ncbi:MAG: bifunctional demethylmenaquinone methyltransferase/2-methoxy-6-polyprenyl-1,4-benzoquinol methylase UbiE [Cyanobacteriota bacterium]|nr:bifunctional demethylmenaquinone methyltransferase/2-methoxy-6-polyprenyl-1,4-benzoquinol methylase UbiE [Cyanobacteriota bacterium]
MPTADIQTPQQIRDLFNRIAPHYDRLNQQMSWGLHHVWKGMAVRWARPKRGSHALDVCCGSGDLALQLARKVGRSGQVYGIDFSEDLLRIAQQRSNYFFPHYPITWVCGDALSLPFPEETFSSVTMGYGLRNVTDIPQALSEIYRVLQKGSWAAILDFHRPQQAAVQQFQKFYLDQVVMTAARQSGVENDYAYIHPSLDHFPTGNEQIRLAEATGFSQVRFYPIAWGLMGILVIQKPS